MFIQLRKVEEKNSVCVSFLFLLLLFFFLSFFFFFFFWGGGGGGGGVVVVLLFYVHDKHLRLYQDGQLT